MADIDAFTPAHTLADAVKRRQVSALELVDAAIARIEKLDKPINAVVVRDFERARADARKIDAHSGEAANRPLLGVPMTVKESFDLRGHPTTWGVEAHREHRATEDALVVQKLKAAGAIVMGKTNVPPVLADWQSDNPIYGRTNNPYDLSRSPGGSSGGSAAALAMGFSALEYGSDIGGSIRVPAAFCGVFGLKTSFGLVSMLGHAAGGEHGAPSLLSVVGPLARDAKDIEIALEVTAGPDAESPANRLALPMPRQERLSSYRVFVLDNHPVAAIDGEVRRVLEETADRLTREGASVARSSNHLPDLAAMHRNYLSMLQTIVTRRSAAQERPPISAHEWFALVDQQLRVRRQWADFFRHFDVLIAPDFSRSAFPHTSEPNWRHRSLTIDGEATPYGAQLAWAGLASFGNLPSTATPMGLAADGLPLSLQVIGPFLEDRTSLDVAVRIARPMPPPKLAI
jgi:amidase